MSRYRAPVWQFNYQYPSQNNESSQHRNLSASLENWDSFSGMDERELNQQGAGSSNGHAESEPYAVPFANRVHSIHRNRAYNASNNNHLLQSYQARTGAVDGRTLAKQRQSGLVTLENHANLIVSKMEQDPDLMEDSPEGEELRKEALRDMPQCLTLKLCVKEKLSRSVSQKSRKKPISCWKNLKYRTDMLISKFKDRIKDLAYTFELWYGALKKIEGNFGSGVGSFFKFLRWIFILNSVISIISFSFIVLPQITYNGDNNETTKDFHWDDIFTGEGYFTNTALYYGFYSSGSVSRNFLTYSMKDAYFFTMIFIYFGCLCVFSYSVAKSYRKNFIETEGGSKNVYAHKVFCGWDYNIATKDAARLKHRAIYNELKELLYDAVHKTEDRSCFHRFLTIGIQLSMHVLILFVLIGIGSLLWFLMEKATAEDWSPIITAVAVNLIMTFAPIFFSVFVKYEGYDSPKIVLGLTLIRIFILGFVIIGVLIAFWLKNPNNICWETALGQEVYRLILFDFIFTVIVSPAIDLIIYLFYRRKQDHPHFDISRHTMQIIYNQTLFWVGFVFSPLLSIVITIKMFCLWYTRQFVLKLCKPSSETWRAAQTQTWFQMMTFLGLLLVGGLLGYMLSYVPSADCGPFRNYKYIYEFLTDEILQLKKNSFVLKILLYITKPNSIAVILIGLCALVYYLKEKAHAQQELVTAYRNMLLWESRDKEFLLKNISFLTEGKWQYNLEGRHVDIDPVISSPGILKNYKYQGNLP
nr:unnamed protein product [Callosobruchus analis]